MAEDTDSDWDSSVLDFSVTPRGPRVIGFNQKPPKDMAAIEEASEHEEQYSPKKEVKINPGVGTKPQSGETEATRNKAGNSRPEGNHTMKNSVTSFVDKTLGQNGHQDSPDIDPPFNFRGMISTDGDSRNQAAKAPGKSRKGQRYDPLSKPIESTEAEINPWDDSEEDERVLGEVRMNFTRPNASPSVGNHPSVHSLVRQSAVQQDSREPGEQGSIKDNFSSGRRKTNRTRLKEKAKKESQPNSGNDGFSSVQQTLVPLCVEQSESGGKFLPQVLLEDGTHGKRYLYFFDQGNMQYSAVEAVDGSSVMPQLANKLEKVAGRCIKEAFGCLRIVFLCAVLFTVELTRFVFGVILGPIVAGLIGAIGDYLIKPVFAGLFNSLIQPCCALLWNIFSGFKHALDPLLQITREIANQVAVVFNACRLVQITYTRPSPEDNSLNIQNV